MYLVQIEIECDDSLGVKLMNEYEIIKTTNEMDFNGISRMRVWEVHKELGKVRELHSLGWQPNCLIQYADEDGTIVISGYGEDH